MGLWDTLRTAVNLAARVDEIDRRCSAVELEWGEVLRLLKRREERERKSNARAVKAVVDPSPADTPVVAVGDRKAHLRALVRRRQEG